MMLKKILFKRIAYRLFSSKAKTYAENKMKTKRLLSESEKKASSHKTSLKHIWSNIRILFQLLKAWTTGEYRDVPYRTIIMILVGLIYFISPIDLIPDFLTGPGLLDDTAVLAFLLSQITPDLNKFVQWKENQQK